MFRSISTDPKVSNMQAYLFPQETYNAKTKNARPLDSAKASNVSSSLKKDHRSSERTGQPGLDYGAQQDWLQVNSKEKIPENNWRRMQKKVLPGPEWGWEGWGSFGSACRGLKRSHRPSMATEA